MRLGRLRVNLYRSWEWEWVPGEECNILSVGFWDFIWTKRRAP